MWLGFQLRCKFTMLHTMSDTVLPFLVINRIQLMIRQIFLTAILTGLLAGLALTGIQSVRVTPLILAAEEYEEGELIPYSSHAQTQSHTHAASEAHTEIKPTEEHSHDEEAWGPKDGFERLFFTFVANVFLSTGWAFILCAVYMYLKELSILKGVIAGGIGYLVFFALPSTGLSPELPGTLASALEHRQAWWIGTVLCSAVGFAIIFFNTNKVFRVCAFGLILLPHIIGAPVPDVHGGTAPLEMFNAYVKATFISNGIFWLILGAISVTLFQRFQTQEVK